VLDLGTLKSVLGSDGLPVMRWWVMLLPLALEFTYAQWSAVYNALSFRIAGMGSATMFFWLQLGNFNKGYRTALAITGLVTFIATYRYFRIFNSWVDAFEVTNSNGGNYTVKVTGAPFNDAYRYVDWLLNVLLLLIEVILVMKLREKQTNRLCWNLGTASAIMVALGYPGEIQVYLAVRWQWWLLAMIPFTYVVGTLIVGLGEATIKQPTAAVSASVANARYLTEISWLTYPFVYIAPMIRPDTSLLMGVSLIHECTCPVGLSRCCDTEPEVEVWADRCQCLVGSGRSSNSVLENRL